MKSVNIMLLGVTIMILVGCEAWEAPVYERNQELRQEIFFKCLKEVPAGPAAAHYNDWDEVVSECGQQAEWLSKRCVEHCR